MNRNALRIALACGAMLALAACGGGDDPMVTLPDSGPAVDGGGGGRDAGTARRDGGGGSMCPAQVVPGPTTPQCAAATATCMMMAMTQMEFQACIDADPNAMGCNQCLFQDVLATCTAEAGCDDEWGNVQCCFDENCPTPTEACLMGPCASQADAIDECLGAGQMSMACGITNRCFPAASGFLPTFEHRRFLPLQISISEQMLRGAR